MKKLIEKITSDKEMLKDAYIKQWLSKVAQRTQKNYIERFPRWLAFIGMSPTEQILKRFKDLQSSNPKERGFFEDKVVEFNNCGFVHINTQVTICNSKINPLLSKFWYV